jgi:uncharacterized protein with PIN domain
VGPGLVSSDYLVQDRDTVEVFEYAAAPDTTTEPRFVLDGHLGRLNAHLRMLGYDCTYQNTCEDDVLLGIANADGRILLTRDRRLLMHKSLHSGHLVRNEQPNQQLHEVVRQYGLDRWIKPFRRCIRCNHLLEPVDKMAILDRLETLTKLYFDEFHICPACQQIYWKGSHFDKMRRIVASLERHES